jgi:hypothetical protein
MDPPAFAVSGKVSSSSGAAGIAGATVYFSSVPGAAANATVTATCDANGNYSRALPNGQWYVSASGPGHFPSADQTVTLNGYPAAGVDFALSPASAITVTSGAGGAVSPSGSVLLTSGSSQTFTIAPSGGYSIGSVRVDGVEQGSVTSYSFTNVSGDHSVEVTFVANSFSVPQTGSLIESARVESLPASGPTGDWSSYLPAGRSYAAMSSPTVATLGGTKWALALRADSDGFDCGDYGTTPIPCNGASIVTVVKPIRNSTSDSWNSIVDVFYNRFVLGILNNTGRFQTSSA